ncbi:hypothetical protein MSG28_002962 [Choristoneura fumiferana]|uniref:Uncharacterized protein n=1 Tax=Choristoneura fumiferana TaxID=7141 RepID=A0ACC0JK18_CHOFU|nr:hypothetical protein MSG28_002962 [Choristoneura fumiferana]
MEVTGAGSFLALDTLKNAASSTVKSILHDPESELRNTMERIGFKDINVRAPLKTFIFDGGVNEFRDLMKCLNPFDSLKAKWEEFMDDYEKLNPDAGTIEYRLIIAYGSK